MSLSRIYFPSIGLVLEAEQHSFFIPEPSSVIIPIDDLPSSSYSHPQVDPQLTKPVNLGHEELEGDEHFSFVVQFPEGLEIREEYNEVGRIVPQEKRPSTSRGFPSRNEKPSVPQHTRRGFKTNSNSTWRSAFRKVYPAIVPTALRRRIVQH